MYSAIGDARNRIARDVLRPSRPLEWRGSLSVATRSADIVDTVAGVTIAPGDTAFGADARPAALDRQRLREMDESGLGRAVGRVVR